jgi:hypothetical protein
MFAQLHWSTVHNWIATDRRGWKSNFLEHVQESRYSKPGKGRIQLLQPYPEIERSVQNTFLGLRKVGIAVNAGLARSVYIGTIEATHLELLQHEQYQYIPVLRICTVQNSFNSQLNWTFRAATKASQKLPSNRKNNAK